MSGIHNAISAIRSQVFNTIHNPTNARTGAKYLRRPLRGPAMTKYYPKLPNLARLNAQIASNKYANWAGASSGSLGEGSKASGRVAARQLGTVEEFVGSAGMEEVERRPGAGWLQDERERVRRTEVEIKHALGKGPPKKGEGRRSQMKKR